MPTADLPAGPPGITSAEAADRQDLMDGSAADRALGQVFVDDISAASAQCAACGRTGTLADTRVSTQGPEVVVRCPGCNHVLLRLVLAPHAQWLDMRGVSRLTLSPEPT